MFTRIAVVFAFSVAPVFCGDWSPRMAAEYLDARQQAWFAWPAANSSGVTCVSCHTGVPYLLARPALRHALGESAPTSYETGLLNGMKARAAKTDLKELFPKSKGPHASEALGVEAVFAALFLATEDARNGNRLSETTEKAFDRLWSLQIREGKAAGAWDWNSYELDPWETPQSTFYGAALAALATGTAPTGYRARPEIQHNVSAMIAYLQREQETQPLHNRLAFLWASTKLSDLLPAAMRAAIVDEVWSKQQADGGWTLASLGAWKKHPEALESVGSNGYATGLVAFVMQKAGAERSNPRLIGALDWLKAHQDRQVGDWPSSSMNHRYDSSSMPSRFMQDAATGYATLALLEAAQPAKH
jgi:hypothetical protein